MPHGPHFSCDSETGKSPAAPQSPDPTQAPRAPRTTSCLVCPCPGDVPSDPSHPPLTQCPLPAQRTPGLVTVPPSCSRFLMRLLCACTLAC